MLRLTSILLAFISIHVAAEEDVFLEGFPDVPVLPVVKSVEDSPVIFDTPSGTVAEATLILRQPSAVALKLYAKALTPLGWLCKESGKNLLCKRDENRLTLGPENQNSDSRKLILSLAPQK